MQLYNVIRRIKEVTSNDTFIIRELKFFLNSRKLFNVFKDSYNTAGMTDIQRAARFFMVIKTSYGSKLHSYGCVKKDIPTVVKYQIVQEKLSKVVIENRDFEDVIKTFLFIMVLKSITRFNLQKRIIDGLEKL